MRFALGCLLLLCGESHAYFLPGSFVFQKSVQPRAGLKSIEWIAKVTDLKANFVFQENLWVNFQSGKVGVNYTSPLNEPLGSVQTAIPSLGEFGQFWICLGLDPSMARARKAMEELKVAPAADEEARLGRIGNRVVWFWGDDARIQYEKDEFTPAQYQNEKGTGAETLLFQTYAVGSEKARIPKNVVFRSGGKDLYLFELRAIKVDLPLKEKASGASPQAAEIKEWVSLVR